MSSRKIDCRLQRLGASLPEQMRTAPIDALWHPLLFDWLATVFTLGYSVFLIVDVGWIGVMMLIASAYGMAGLWKLKRHWRLRSTWVLALAYGFLAMVMLDVRPIPFSMVYLFAAHATMEVVVCLRCATDPRHHWGD